MSENPINNQKVLFEQQYKSTGNFSSRTRLHELFTVTDINWFDFVFQHINPQPGQTILELGSGTGLLWQETINQLPAQCHIHLTDFSEAMIDSLQKTIVDKRFSIKKMDAQNITFPDHTFDIVVANHMLYHVPDVSKALQEIRRVLKPDGKLIAATNGDKHMAELYSMLFEFDPTQGPQSRILPFNLENGEQILAEHFSKVECQHHNSHLRITVIEPLLAYYRSMQTMGIDFDQFDQEKFAAFLQNKLEKNGHILIQKAQGLFIASN